MGGGDGENIEIIGAQKLTRYPNWSGEGDWPKIDAHSGTGDWWRLDDSRRCL